MLHFRERNGSNIKGHITLTGGEPFVKKEFPELLEKIASDSDLYTFAILTNGTMIDDSKGNWLKRLKPRYIQVSLDGNKPIHDSIRGSGNFDATKKAISILKSKNIRTMVSFTANRNNYQSFPEVARVCRELNVDFLWSDRLIPEGNAEQGKGLLMSSKETHLFFQIMKQEEKKCREDVNTRTRIKMHRALQFQYSNTRPYRCVAGETLLTVMPNGDLYPCRRMPVKVGNVFETPLASLYFSSSILRNLRGSNTISKGCESCASNNECRGGLKCLSYAVYGDAHIKDPGCEL